jgi:hypothetical protein
MLVLRHSSCPVASRLPQVAWQRRRRCSASRRLLGCSSSSWLELLAKRLAAIFSRERLTSEPIFGSRVLHSSTRVFTSSLNELSYTYH